ncbi:MAG: TVP38/TMEM64 family protein [Acidimicrobiales bacterium]|nr:TVP38/TMEM64 family protein [Acidimicrobiales bacterium]
MVLGLFAVALVVLFFVLGGDRIVSEPEELQEFVERRGVWGPVLFVLLMWLVQPFGVPGAVFMVPAGLVWSLPAAVALSWIGNMGASTIAFLAARRLGRDWVAGRMPPKVQRWDDRLANGGLPEVIALRVVTGQLPPADWMLGVSSVRWPPFLIGTAIGILPGIFLVLVAGVGVVSWLAERPIVAIAGTVGIVVLSAVARRRQRIGA